MSILVYLERFASNLCKIFAKTFCCCHILLKCWTSDKCFVMGWSSFWKKYVNITVRSFTECCNKFRQPTWNKLLDLVTFYSFAESGDRLKHYLHYSVEYLRPIHSSLLRFPEILIFERSNKRNGMGVTLTHLIHRRLYFGPAYMACNLLPVTYNLFAYFFKIVLGARFCRLNSRI